MVRERASSDPGPSSSLAHGQTPNLLSMSEEKWWTGR